MIADGDFFDVEVLLHFIINNGIDVCLKITEAFLNLIIKNNLSLLSVCSFQI